MNRALIAIFIGLLWLPTIDSFWKLDRCPAQNEKRKLAALPSCSSVRNTGTYLAGLQNYFDDHFGFRNQLVHWNNHWKLKLFNESPVDLAMQGRDGWLYWASDDMLGTYTGTSRFVDQTLAGWQKLLEARRDWLAARGAQYIFVIAPDKHSIYPEYLPEWVVKGGQPSKLDQLMAYMRAHSTVEVLDLRPALLAAKEEGLVYQKTDTHWNNLGAFIACQQLIRSLQGSFPRLNPLPLDAFERKNVIERGGDLAVCLDERDDVRETQEIEFVPRPPRRALQQTGDGPTITENPNAIGKVVIFRDSFGEKWIPFLGYHFREAIYFRQAQWKKPFLEREKPDLVIDEMVERIVNNQDPRQLLIADQ